MLPDPEGLRDTIVGPVKKAVDAAEMERCATLRAEAILTRDGSLARSGLYDASTIATLAVGTVGFMLAKILNGDIVIKDAKQAADIANIALKISTQVIGPGEQIGDINAPEARADKIAKLDDLLADLKERAGKKRDADAEESKAGGVDLSEFDLDDDDHPPVHLRSVHSTAS